MSETVSLAALRKLVGQSVNYKGRACQIVEILNDAPAPQLVLSGAALAQIQSDQFGDARRRTPETVTVPIYLQDGCVLPFIAALLND